MVARGDYVIILMTKESIAMKEDSRKNCRREGKNSKRERDDCKTRKRKKC
jgi:hypothetical protein